MYRRSLHCLASSRGAKTQNEISPLYIVGSDRVATLQSDKRIFFKTLAATCTTRASSSLPPTPATPRQHMFPPGRRRTTTKHLPRPGAASPPPSLLTERMLILVPHPISPFFRWPHHNPSPPTINHHPRLCAMSEGRAVHHAIGQARPGARQRVGSHISRWERSFW